MPRSSSFLFPVLVALAGGTAGAAFAQSTPAIISEGGAGTFWRQVTPNAIPPFPANADASEDVCVGVSYLIKADGTTSDFALLKSWTSKHAKGVPSGAKYEGFTRGAVAAVAVRKYAPAQATAAGALVTPVYTASTFAFSSRPDADQQALRAHCVVEDLPGFVAKVQHDARKDTKNLRRAEMERARVANPPNITGTANGGVR
jgi:hypothetical protein